MKIKRIKVVRPEIEIEFNRPVLGRLYFLFIAPRLFKIKVHKVCTIIKSAMLNDAGHVKTYKIWLFCIPKIKVVDVT